MIKYFSFASVFLFVLWIGVQVKSMSEQPLEKMQVQKVIEELGGEESPNYPNKLLVGASAEIGENIVKFGNSRGLEGGFTKRQSKHFVCTSCHNIEQESAFLNFEDPQERLDFTNEKGLPFLQGSPLFGIVNRTSFYNGDYEKKYGDLVIKARNNIREAIQLCAVECSQGRALKDWEVESILMYLWKIDLKLENLVLDQAELDVIESAVYEGQKKEEARKIIKTKYLSNAPAHFMSPPEDYKKGIESITGNPENGAKIYDNACLFCHERNDYSYYELDSEKLTFKQLKNQMDIYDQRSFYHVVRYGTKPLAGKKAYMPHYTEEKMSNQQMEDLRSYIIQKAE